MACRAGSCWLTTGPRMIWPPAWGWSWPRRATRASSGREPVAFLDADDAWSVDAVRPCSAAACFRGSVGPSAQRRGTGSHALPLRSLKRILDRQRDKQRSTIQQSFWGGSAGMPGSDCALLPRHHRAQVFYLRMGQMAWTPSRKMIFSLRLTGSTSQPIEFPGGESGRDGEVSSFPPLPPVHQRQGFRITGRHRNGGKTRGQDNPSLARDNART